MKKLILIACSLIALSTSAQFGSPFNQSALYINQQIPFCPSVDSCLGLGGTDTTLVLSKSGAFVHMSGGGEGGVSDTIQCIQSRTINIPTIQILGSHSSPVTLIPAPGSGKYIQLINGSGTYTRNTTSFSSSNQSGFIIGDTNSFAGGTIDITRSNSVYNPTIVTGNANGQDLVFLNKPIQFYTQADNPSLGNGSIQVTLLYSVIDASGNTICSNDTFHGGDGSVDTTQFWLIHGNSGTDGSVNFLGTTDDQNIIFKRNNIVSGFIGHKNTGLGENVLNNGTVDNETVNVAVGDGALGHITSGAGNVAIGHVSGGSITDELANTLIGDYSDISAGVHDALVLGGATCSVSNQLCIVNSITSFYVGHIDGYSIAGGILTTDGASNASFTSIQAVLASLPSYANDAAAAIGGLSVGDSYYSTTLHAYVRREV